jgi:hypothetical protein
VSLFHWINGTCPYNSFTIWFEEGSKTDSCRLTFNISFLLRKMSIQNFQRIFKKLLLWEYYAITYIFSFLYFKSINYFNNLQVPSLEPTAKALLLSNVHFHYQFCSVILWEKNTNIGFTSKSCFKTWNSHYECSLCNYSWHTVLLQYCW